MRIPDKGFTLIEIVVVIAILTLLIGMVAPSVISSVKLSKAEKEIAVNMDYIVQASINFYNDSKEIVGERRWPADISEMKTYGYIPEAWSDINPWGNPYFITFPTNYILRVNTVVPTGLAYDIKGRLKLSEVAESGNNSTVSTNVPIPWTDTYPDCGWSDGTDYNGADLILTNGQIISGRHKKINTFKVPAGVTASVTQYNGLSGGFLEICARNVVIEGTLSADGSGYKGGCGGEGTSCPRTPAPGKAGQGPFGGLGSPGGNSCYRCNASPGSNGNPGGYAAVGINGDSSTDESLLMGSGGGGAGGGGSSYGPNCTSYGLSTGGGGGAGGIGGGYIKLYAVRTMQITGNIYARGILSGNGQNGRSYSPGSWCSLPCSVPTSSGGNPDVSGSSSGGSGGPPATNVGRGGNGGRGGNSAGGGILLKSPSIIISGTINNRGSNNNQTNGGTIKIFYRGSPPGGTKLGGRLYETTF